MPELIDKKKAQTEIAFIAKSDAQKAIIGRILFMLDKMQAIEPEVRCGRWIEVAKHRAENGTILTDYECSECFAMLKDSDSEQIKDERFCYNCGAKMDADHIADASKT